MLFFPDLFFRLLHWILSVAIVHRTEYKGISGCIPGFFLRILKYSRSTAEYSYNGLLQGLERKYTSHHFCIGFCGSFFIRWSTSHKRRFRSCNFSRRNLLKRFAAYHQLRTKPFSCLGSYSRFLKPPFLLQSIRFKVFIRLIATSALFALASGKCLARLKLPAWQMFAQTQTGFL